MSYNNSNFNTYLELIDLELIEKNISLLNAIKNEILQSRMPNETNLQQISTTANNISESIEADFNNTQISDLLINLHCRPNLLGFKYLKAAIEIVLSNPEAIYHITKTIYPEISKIYNSSSSKVERSIRHTIETSFERLTENQIKEIFGNITKKPTNSHYIASICEYLKRTKNISVDDGFSYSKKRGF